MRELDVLEQVRVDRRRGELGDGLGDLGSGRLDGDVGVRVEVDARLLLGRVADLTEEVLLGASVGRARDVLAVLPRAVAVVAAGAVARATTTARAEAAARGRGSSARPASAASTGREGSAGRRRTGGSAPVAATGSGRGHKRGRGRVAGPGGPVNAEHTERKSA